MSTIPCPKETGAVYAAKRNVIERPKIKDRASSTKGTNRLDSSSYTPCRSFRFLNPSKRLHTSPKQLRKKLLLKLKSLLSHYCCRNCLLPQNCLKASFPKGWKLYIDIYQYWLANAFNLWDDAFEVKCFCQDDLEDLLDIDGG